MENSTGYENTASGYQALQMNTTGWQNTAQGAWALNANSYGHSNTAHGTGALRGNIVGYNNTAIGSGALYINTTGWQNTALGASTLVNSTGSGNTAIGWGSMHLTTTGQYNTAIGMWALYNNNTGNNNTILGTGAGTNANGLSSCIAVGYNATATADYQAVIGTVANTNLTGGFGAWQDLSDARFKRQIQEDVPGLQFIARLRPVTYTLDAYGVDAFLGIAQRMDTLPDQEGRAHYRQRLNEVSTQRQTGFIAQEVEEAARSVGYDFCGVHHPISENDHYTLGYASFTVPIVKAIQELHATVQDQQNINEQLREELEVLRKELREMKTGR
ncbi:MAG: tail fiber domain-containing protein [Flavobacteriales bacterium]|nr:tail fiber domain-containing protein [Flavobacteriales bacterium]